jgi:tripartite-type tricarboxylate transporter receptor subunit TctC
VLETSQQPDAARALLEFLSSEAVAPLIAETGLTPVAAASDYPSRPVNFIVGFGVGGSADRMTRAMSRRIGAALGQPVRVLNRGGAGTLLAANYVLDQPDDGYTVFASSFSPYLSNTILEGNAEYTIEDFAYLNFQWFDEDLLAVNAESRFTSLPELLEAIRTQPKTVRASVVRGSAGHLTARLLLEVSGIPQENLNLVAYNSGGQARAAVAGHVVDFIVISAEGSESIREYIRPLAIVSDRRSRAWDVPTLAEAMAPTGIDVPVLPGSIRGLATTAEFRRQYPERFATLATAVEQALADAELAALMDRASIGHRWIGPDESQRMMRETFAVFEQYSYLLEY